MEFDIDPILQQWRHKPGELTVRRITGRDGKPKLQMRLDLGLLQMDVENRPDGVRPHGCESLLSYHLGRLTCYKQANGVEIGFELTADECKALREEVVMYYYRYLSLFILGEYDGVVQDTKRNLEAFDLCRKFAAKREDRFCLEQYRPYVIMMHCRAKAQLALDAGDDDQALMICREGIDQITDFFKEISKPELADRCSELAILQSLQEEIKQRVPVDPAHALHADLTKALEREQYEKAAELRDKLRSLSNLGMDSAQQQPQA